MFADSCVNQRLCPQLTHGSHSSLSAQALSPGPWATSPSPAPVSQHSGPREEGCPLQQPGEEQDLAHPPWGTSQLHSHAPTPILGHRLADTYSALWRWDSRVLQSSSTRCRANLLQASCREPLPCSGGSPWARARTPRPWAVASPGAELQRAVFPKDPSKDESAASRVTSFHPKPLVEPVAASARPTPP